MKSKIWLIVSVLLIAMMLLTTGCGQKPASTTEETAPAGGGSEATSNGPVKITIFVGFGTGTEPEQIELHNQIAKEFNESHDDIQIEFITVPYEEHSTKFSTMLAGDMAPDIVMPIGVAGTAEFQDEWLDLKPYVERDNYDMSDFYGPAMELQYVGDKLIGLPLGVYPSAVYYNEDMFDAAGVPYPPHKFGDPDWTYDKLVEIAQKLTLDANGNDATSPDFDAEHIVQWGWDGWDWIPFRMVPSKFGGDSIGMSEDYRTAEMNSKPWVDALQFVSDSVWKWHIRPSAEEIDAVLGDMDALESGMVAMWEIHSWMSYNYDTWSEAFNWNVAAIPAGPDGSIVDETNIDGIVIPSHSKHPDQAWEVVKWLTQPEVMERLTDSYGCIPARKSLAENWLSKMSEAYPNVDFQVFLDGIEYMDNPNYEAWVPDYGEVFDATEHAMELVLTGENTDVKAILDALNEEVQGYLDEYWAEH
jgi:multiple sugar transport system substrate-binding protein